MANENQGGSTPSQESLTQEQKDQQAAARYRQQLSGSVESIDDLSKIAKTERPETIPEKFWDAEKGEVRLDELAKAYRELETKQSQQKPTKDGEQPGGKQGENVDEGGDTALAEFTALRDQATQKLMAGEGLTDEMYAGFEKRGLSREDVDTFIAGQEALGKLAALEVHNEVGGEEAYKTMIDWARENFTAEEVAVYDRDIHSNDKNVRLVAARGLKARYEQNVGHLGRSVSGKGGSKNGGGYASGAEMRAEMADPRYRKDPAFRAEVARKAQAARAAGIDLSAM